MQYRYEVWRKTTDPINGLSVYRVIKNQLTKYVALEFFNQCSENRLYFKSGKLLLIRRTCKTKENDYRIIKEYEFLN